MKQVMLAVAASIFLVACSTAPRVFSPVLAESSAPGPEFDAALQRCTQLVDAGVRSDFRNSPLTAGALGAAAGYSVGGVVFVEALASGASAGAITSATLVAMPVVGILVASTYAHSRRAAREREIQAAMTRCLAEEGYTVQRWRRQAGRDQSTPGASPAADQPPRS